MLARKLAPALALVGTAIVGFPPAVRGEAVMVVGLNAESSIKTLFDWPGCVEPFSSPVLRRSQMSGLTIRVVDRKTVVTKNSDGKTERVEMLEIELDGKNYCVPRLDVELSTDRRDDTPRVASKRQTDRLPVSASRGMGEGQE